MEYPFWVLYQILNLGLISNRKKKVILKKKLTLFFPQKQQQQKKHLLTYIKCLYGKLSEDLKKLSDLASRDGCGR